MKNLVQRLLNLRRPPDFVIGHVSNPYLLRWWLIPRNPWFNVYLHCILRDDDDRALHDHPWWNVSVILRGGYFEIMPQETLWRGKGHVVFRRPTASHRLVLAKAPGADVCWSLFFTGPRIREWGFHCPKGWVHCFTHPADKGQIGRGCG